MWKDVSTRSVRRKIYVRPGDRFVASFVGDANVLRGRLERIDAADAIITWGGVKARVPAAPWPGSHRGGAVDLFVRPEQLEVSDVPGTHTSVGTIAVQVYRGGHVDLYLDSANCLSGRLLVSLPAHETMLHWSAGTQVNVSIGGGCIVGFPAV